MAPSAEKRERRSHFRGKPRPVRRVEVSFTAGDGTRHTAFTRNIGVGGAFVSVPFMTWCNVKIHNAVATSAALGFPIALAGTSANIYYGMNTPGLPPGSLGFVYLPALLVVSLTSVLAAPLGAKTAHRLPVRTLKKVFALTMFVLAGYMLYRTFR